MNSVRHGVRLERITGIVVGTIFLLSGLLKLQDVDAFVVTVRSFGILPAFMVPLFSVVIIVMEILCGTALLFDRRRRDAAALLFMLMLMFTAAVMNVLIKGEDQLCGCFGDRYTAPVDAWTIVRNIILMLLILRLYRTAAVEGSDRQ
ncbi:MAG: DoxX family membrane protein [Bacteroidetes bacterium]|nr:DoxX family membrane protein [Bacteroidota bacterium]